MTPEQATWVQEHVLTPREIPPPAARCPCQIVSNACETGEHSDCGHDYWTTHQCPERETVIGQGFGPFPCKGSLRLYGNADVYLADRQCRVWCNCHCHQPAPQPTAAPHRTEQLDLFAAVT
ncbi:hypothetical protein L0F81_23770 [Streptomyces tricolor]|uniref:Uncharacterized protein n=1 Tax=Streptomyces tricolor TaxID=68277 RepID=A0ABS9JL65_9ACTN|nr:hypothetical protein [Streptomyces tricolor]MCG0066271.1 hypothetical protein [Streptomyces tricolor]